LARSGKGSAREPGETIAIADSGPELWPSLPFDAWRDTRATLHLWLQIVGKIRLAQSPWLNHSWHVTLYVTPRGLTTLSLPHGKRAFQIDFDFIDHSLVVRAADGRDATMRLQEQSVAAFYHGLMRMLDELQVPVKIQRKPNELKEPIPFDRDEVHGAYDAKYAQRFWRVLLNADRVLNVFRARFRGKSSPVHFFWGNNDLAVSRFSGRRAPEHPGGRPHLPDWVLKDAYSHEVSECGFWPGSEEHPQAAFYCNAYPQPPGLPEARVAPGAAYYSKELQEFILPYEAMRTTSSPQDALLEFAQSTYEAVATRAGWDRELLEAAPPEVRMKLRQLDP